MRNLHWRLFVCILLGLSCLSYGDEELRITPTDKDSGAEIPCRIHLKKSDGKPFLPAGFPAWKDHIDIPGAATLTLPAGRYSFDVEHGPEYESKSGEITVTAGGRQSLALSLKRVVDMSARGWWSGETHIHRPLSDIELLMRAEDLHVGPVITWWGNRTSWTNGAIPQNLIVRFDGNRIYDVLAGEDERNGGALLYFNMPKPLPLAGTTPEYPSPMKFLSMARQFPNIRVDIEKPFWWDMPIWISSGKVDTIGIANNHMDRSEMMDREAWGKPRDRSLFPPPLGNGYWTQEIYYQLLNSGIRIAPSAGSASGVLPNPVGYNRAYVQIDGELTYDKWWSGLAAGRSFVTNGPMLLAKADGQLSGHVFKSAERELTLKLDLELISREAVRAIEIIKDGKVDQKLDPSATKAAVHFDSSGWILVRAMGANDKTFRFASTAPWYVELGTSPRRISKASAQFFIDWVAERKARIKLPDAGRLEEVLAPFAAAEAFWKNQLSQSNAP